MAKYHITKKGEVAVCKATVEACPLGGVHFETAEMAEAYLEKENIEKYGYLPFVNEYSELERINLDDSDKYKIIETVKDISGIRSKGFDYEIFASSTIAKRMGLNQMAVTDMNGKITGATNNIDEKIMKQSVAEAISGVKEYYQKEGASIVDETALARVIYYSNNPKDNRIFVLSGGPNVLDSAIVEANEVVDIGEIKKLHSGGAQIPSKTIDVNKYGEFTNDFLASSDDYIQDALKGMTIQDAYGTNPVLNFNKDFGSNDDKRLPLKYFVDTYKSKGAKTFLYTYDDGDKIGEINLNKDTEEVIDEMISKKISATLFLRANNNTRKATVKDLERFETSENIYFKDGSVPKGDTFRLGQLNKDMVSYSKGRVRIGGFLTNIKKEDFHGNRIVKKKELESFRLNLTGDIKVNK